MTTVAVVRSSAPPGCLGDVGFNWPAAGRVYLAGVTDRSTTTKDPARPLAAAADRGLNQVRVLLGVDAAISTWLSDPARALAGLRRLVDDAAAKNIRLVISNYPDQAMIEALAGHPYPTWASAQRDLTTPGSVPWTRFQSWLSAIVPPLATSPTVASWEVVNEPGYMLGMDSGAVATDAGISFFDHFAELLKQLGARTVNGGGRPVFNPLTLTDEQVTRYVRHLDVLDDHLYEQHAPATSAPNGSAAQGDAAVAATARWFARARKLAGRPLPAMIGEVGSQPTDWFEGVLSSATRRGWPVLAWAFDAYDENTFTETTNAHSLDILGGAATRAQRANGDLAVVVGSPLCRRQTPESMTANG